MDQSSKNESKANGNEIYEDFMNDVIMEERYDIIPMCKLKQKKLQKNE